MVLFLNFPIIPNLFRKMAALMVRPFIVKSCIHKRRNSYWLIVMFMFWHPHITDPSKKPTSHVQYGSGNVKEKLQNKQAYTAPATVCKNKQLHNYFDIHYLLLMTEISKRMEKKYEQCKTQIKKSLVLIWFQHSRQFGF